MPSRPIVEASTRSAGEQPEVGSKSITKYMEPCFRDSVAGDGDRGVGNAATAKHPKGDRLGAGHVEVGGDQVKMSDIAAFEVADEGGEVGDGVNGAVVNVQTVGQNALSFESRKAFFWRRGDPDGHCRIVAGKFCSSDFTVRMATKH